MKKYDFIYLVLFSLWMPGCANKIQVTKTKNTLLFSQKNLIAWCIVPYDSKKRNSEERALMLKDLGFTSFAYDWRAQDLPNMETELATLKKYNISLKAVWFWVSGANNGVLDEANETILKELAKSQTKTELWVSFPASYF